MAHAFRIRFWETFNAPGTYDILTDNQYKLPNSNDGCMWLRAPTTCPEWNEGMDEDIAVLHWLSKNAGLTSECVTEVIEAFNQYPLLNRLSDAEAQAKPLDNAMVVDEPAKPVAGSSKHPNDVDIIDGELIY